MLLIVRVLERLTSAVGYVAALLIIPLTLATCYEVFSRYVFGAPTIWAFELGYSLMGVHFIVGAALTLRLRGHIRIDLLYSHFSLRTRVLIDLVGYLLLFLPFLVLLTDSLWDYAYRAYLTGERTGQSAWNPVLWPFRMALVAGFALLALQVVSEMVKCVAVLRGLPVRYTEGE